MVLRLGISTDGRTKGSAVDAFGFGFSFSGSMDSMGPGSGSKSVKGSSVLPPPAAEGCAGVGCGREVVFGTRNNGGSCGVR